MANDSLPWDEFMAQVAVAERRLSPAGKTKPEKARLLPGETGIQDTLKLVEILSDAKVAKLLSDPMRRAILNLLRERPMAESDLADSLGLTDASISYHLGLLRRARLIAISKKEIEEHGILKKFYEPSAYLYLADVESLPKSVARYYFPIDLERIRAILGTIPRVDLERLRLSGLAVDSLGEELAKILIRVARRYEDERVRPGDGEAKVQTIYSESIAILRKTLESRRE